MGGRNIGVQFERLLKIRCGSFELPNEKLGFCKKLPTLCIERIQVNGPAVQLKSLIKAAENGCRVSRRPNDLGISGIESNRPLKGSMRSNPIEVDLLLNPSHLSVGLCQVRV